MRRMSQFSRIQAPLFCCDFVIQTGQAATIWCSQGDEGHVYEGAKGEIAELTKGYAEEPKVFVDLLARGVSRIAATFSQNP